MPLATVLVPTHDHGPTLLHSLGSALAQTVVNAGTDTWPWDAELGPPIRMTYRIYDQRGTIVVGDGPHTAFPRNLPPGGSTVVPLDFLAPVIPGAYQVGADVVHEGVRWFGCEARFDIEVEHRPDWREPDAGIVHRVRRALGTFGR